MALTEGVALEQLDARQVSELQRVLAMAGFDPGPLDGIIGPRTRAAYGRFLSSNGGGDPNVVSRLTAQLTSNEIPELWDGIQSGAEAPAAAAPAPAVVPAAPAGGTVAPGALPAAPVLSDSSQEQAVRERFPQLSYLMDNPEIRALLLQAASTGATVDMLQARLMQTNWWRTTAETTRLWDAKFHLDPAKATAEWDQRTLTVLNQARTLGAPLSASDGKWVAGKVLREGWSQEQLSTFLGGLIRNNGGAEPGKVTETEAQIRQLARSYLGQIDKNTVRELAIRISEGSSSKDAVTTMLRNEAKNRFHWFAPQIDAGLTPMDLFASTRNAVANMLEIDPEQIDLNDSRWSSITSPIQDGSNIRSMNFAEAQQWARNRPEWRMTNNANNEASDLGLKLLRSMGVLGGGGLA